MIDIPRNEVCAVCGDVVKIGGIPPTYYYPLDQSETPDHKVMMAPNPSGPFACDYACLMKHEQGQNSVSESADTDRGGDSR